MAELEFKPGKTTEMTPEQVMKAQQEEQVKKFEEFINSPISKEEAEKSMANLAIQQTQLEVQRVRAMAQVNNIDQQLAMVKHEQQVIYRRTLNKE